MTKAPAKGEYPSHCGGCVRARLYDWCFWRRFPVTPSAFQPSNAGSTDAIVSKFDPTGSFLVYSTNIGGSSTDEGLGIVVDPIRQRHDYGNYNVPQFSNDTRSFAQRYFGAEPDAFVAKLNADGTALIYSTFLGGVDGFNFGRSVATDGSGNAYVTGNTIASDFPTTPELSRR